MFKNTIARLIFTTSPIELLFGGGVRCHDSGDGIFAATHSSSRRNFHYALSRSKQCSTVSGQNLASAIEQLQQEKLVNVAKCGIAKNLDGPEVESQQTKERNVYGDDAYFIANFDDIYVAGVADGVGGWRNHGIDPSEFSSKLMANCADIVLSGKFELNRPDRIIGQAYDKMKTPPRPVGSSTACVVVVNQRKLYAANLGDSGYLILRDGKIVYRSQEQTHYFNAPYQLTLLPERLEHTRGSGTFLLDGPENIDLQEHQLLKGDLVLIASDGLWDNVPEEIVTSFMVGTEPSEASLQARCNALALIARHLSNDVSYDSPFTKRARRHGIRAVGGKPDDVTIVLFYVS